MSFEKEEAAGGGGGGGRTRCLSGRLQIPSSSMRKKTSNTQCLSFVVLSLHLTACRLTNNAALLSELQLQLTWMYFFRNETIFHVRNKNVSTTVRCSELDGVRSAHPDSTWIKEASISDNSWHTGQLWLQQVAWQGSSQTVTTIIRHTEPLIHPHWFFSTKTQLKRQNVWNQSLLSQAHMLQILHNFLKVFSLLFFPKLHTSIMLQLTSEFHKHLKACRKLTYDLVLTSVFETWVVFGGYFSGDKCLFSPSMRASGEDRRAAVRSSHAGSRGRGEVLQLPADRAAAAAQRRRLYS